MTSSTTTPARTRLSGRTAVFVVFALNGVALGSWAPRVPAITERLHTSPGVFGLTLLGASAGMIIAASLTGRLLEYAGARTVVAGSAALAALILPLLGVVPSVLLLAAVLFCLGASVGAMDVSMNVGGVAVERALGKPIMPVFHAGFSLGALVGSAGAGFAAAHHWSLGRHLVVAAAVMLVVLALVVRAVPDSRAPAQEQAVARSRVAPVRRPVLWLLAGVALCSAVAEGASGDWSALLMVTRHHVDEGAAAFAYSGFSLAMLLARLGGAWLQRRFGARDTLAAGAAVASLGLLGALLPLPAAGFVGFALAGAGLAAAFPIALSLAGAAGKRADGGGGEREISFVTAIAYSGFLGGPPLVGGIAELTSLSVSFVVVAVIAALIVPAAIAATRAGARERPDA